MTNTKNSVVNVVAKYSASRFYRQFLGIFTAYLRPLLLSPQDFGLWNLLRIMPDYVSYSHMGMHSAMRYKIPQARASGDEDTVAEIENTAWGCSLSINGTISLIVVLVGCFGGFGIKESWGLVAMGISFLIVSIYEYQMNLLKAYEEFQTLTSTNYFQITITSLLTVLLLLLFNLYGLFIAFGLSHLLTIWFVYRRFPRFARFKISVSRLKEMIRFGFPVMGLGIVLMLIQTSDRLMISALLGNEQLGFYAISNMIMGFLMNVPGAAREVLEPRLMKELDSSSSEDITFRYLIKPLLNTTYLMPFLVGPVVLCLPVAVSIFLPRYQNGVVATQILATGGFFFAHVIVLRGIIAARNRQFSAVKLVVLPLVLNIVGSVIAVKLGHGIIGVAVSSLIAYMLVYLLLLGLMVYDLGLTSHSCWNAARWRLILPFPTMVLLFLAGSLWTTPLGWYGVPIVGIKTIVFVGLMFALRKVTLMKSGDQK